MDSRIPNSALGIPITGGLLLSKLYEPHNLLSTSSKIDGIGRKDGTLAVVNKNHVNFGPKLLEIVKQKLSYGAKNLQPGREERTFRKSFSTSNSEKLMHASRCYIYTTAGPIAGLIFISTERVGFCSDRSLKMHSTTGELLKYQYKVSIPLGKIKGVEERMNMKKPSNKYVEFVTVDDFNFWFMGFRNYKKTLRCLRHRLSLDCLSN